MEKGWLWHFFLADSCNLWLCDFVHDAALGHSSLQHCPRNSCELENSLKPMFPRQRANFVLIVFYVESLPLALLYFINHAYWHIWCSDCFHSDSNGRSLQKEGDSIVFLRLTILQRSGVRGWEYSWFFQAATEYLGVLTWRSERRGSRTEGFVQFFGIRLCGEAVNTRSA